MRKLRFFIFLVVILLCGCQSANNDNGNGFTVENSNLINTSVEKLLVDSLQIQYKGQVKNIAVTEANNNDKSATFVTYLCERNNKKYSGILVANRLDDQKYELVHLETFELNGDEAITVNNITGEIGGGSVKRRFHIVTGYINEPTVDMIYVKYPSNQVSGHAIKKGQETYTEINIGAEEKPESVIAAAGEKILFQKEYK